jgi:hypothetical protein
MHTDPNFAGFIRVAWVRFVELSVYTEDILTCLLRCSFHVRDADPFLPCQDTSHKTHPKNADRVRDNGKTEQSVFAI